MLSAISLRWISLVRCLNILVLPYAPCDKKCSRNLESVQFSLNDEHKQFRNKLFSKGKSLPGLPLFPSLRGGGGLSGAVHRQGLDIYPRSIIFSHIQKVEVPRALPCSPGKGWLSLGTDFTIIVVIATALCIVRRLYAPTKYELPWRRNSTGSLASCNPLPPCRLGQ